MTSQQPPVDTPEDLQRAMASRFPPSPQQWAAITAPLEPAVVIAGAGSGKTTAMAARVVYLVLTEQVRPEEILGLTFTTKAAAELRTRVRSALRAAGVLPRGGSDGHDVEGGEGGEVLEPTVATYNSWAAELLVEHGLRIGHEPDTRVLTTASRFQLGARAIDRYPGEVQLLSDHPETVIQNLLALDGAMSEHLVTPEQVSALDAEALRRFEDAVAEEVAGKNRKSYRGEVEKAMNALRRRGELLGLVAAYRRLKGELGLMDFSDQIELAARLAVEQPEVGRAQRERFRVVLLDEYQDTSVAQADLLSRVFSGVDAERGRGHAVMAVGDPNQAIYGWRGASASNITRFPETFPPVAGDVRRFPLTVNRRSDVRILEAANALAVPLYDASEVVSPLEPGGEAPGEVGVRVFERRDEELAWLVEAVREAHDPDAPAEAAVHWSDIGVLVRDNSHGEDVFDALAAARVPVEIVGLSGLLRLPEVAEVVAVLHLMQDVGANASLLKLLTGPRWAVGPRDLALLAARAAELAGGRGPRTRPESIQAHLLEIAEALDPSEIPALGDALDDPGHADFSATAVERFRLLSAELRMLRRYVGEPLLDLVRRIIDVTGVDVELASSVSPAAPARRDNLDLFVSAVADFQAIDGDVSLAALLAYLTAEDGQGNGLDAAAPSEADSVKLLTVHRAKGLEWHTVFLVGVCETRFPSNRSRTLWTSSPAVLPAPLRGDAPDLPQLRGWDKPALEDYRRDTREHDRTEELRLGYVAFTRAAHRLWVSSYLWGPRATSFGPSPYQETVRELLRAWGEPDPVWLDKPEKGTANPYDADDPSRPWPAVGPGQEAALRREAAELVVTVDVDAPDDADLVEASLLAQWDGELDRLLVEARATATDTVLVPLPSSLSATAVSRLRADPEGLAADLARPMPHQPSPAARFGTRFHAWVEQRFGQQGMFDPEELPGQGDAGIDDEDDLRELVERFEAGEFGDRTPHAVEAPFALVLAGQVIRGRIDAVYQDGDGFLLVDWKTSTRHDADPLQLAVYRQAWAELHGVDPASVRAAFYYVRDATLDEPDELLDRQALERLLTL